MNLSSLPTASPLAPAEWTMDITRGGNFHYVAELKRKGVLMCRLSLALPDHTDAEVQTALAEKARGWISEYLKRPGGQDART